VEIRQLPVIALQKHFVSSYTYAYTYEMPSFGEFIRDYRVILIDFTDRSSWASGSWVVEKTDDNWRDYLNYLGFPANSSLQVHDLVGTSFQVNIIFEINDFFALSKDAEMNSTDVHRYAFGRHDGKDLFHFWHNIPATKFDLEFYTNTNLTAKTIDDWESNPYPAVTPAGFTPSLQAALSKWRLTPSCLPCPSFYSSLTHDVPSRNAWTPSASVVTPSKEDPWGRPACCVRSIR